MFERIIIKYPQQKQPLISHYFRRNLWSSSVPGKKKNALWLLRLLVFNANFDQRATLRWPSDEMPLIKRLIAGALANAGPFIDLPPPHSTPLFFSPLTAQMLGFSRELQYLSLGDIWIQNLSTPRCNRTTRRAKTRLQANTSGCTNFNGINRSWDPSHQPNGGFERRAIN